MHFTYPSYMQSSSCIVGWEMTLKDWNFVKEYTGNERNYTAKSLVSNGKRIFVTSKREKWKSNRSEYDLFAMAFCFLHKISNSNH